MAEAARKKPPEIPEAARQGSLKPKKPASKSPPPIPDAARRARGDSEAPEASPDVEEAFIEEGSYDRSETVASVKHPGRNEDAVVGDVARIDAELAKAPAVETVFTQIDVDRGMAALRKERTFAEALAENGLGAVLDGVSGKNEIKQPDGTTVKFDNEGTGWVASRIAGAEIAERVAELPAGAPQADAERGLAEALLRANDAIKMHKETAFAPVMLEDDRDARSKELSQMATTATLMLRSTSPEGRPMMSIASVGDSRAYRWNAETKKLDVLTVDDNVVGYMLRKKGKDGQPAPMINRAQYDAGMAARNPAEAARLGVTADYEVTAAAVQKLGLSMDQARNAVTMALGSDTFNDAAARDAVQSVEIKPGDAFYATTDGLHDNLSHQEMQEMLEGGQTWADVVAEGRRRAAAEGGKADDVSSVERPGQSRGRGGPESAKEDPETVALAEKLGYAKAKADELVAAVRRHSEGDKTALEHVDSDAALALHGRALEAEARALRLEMQLLDRRGNRGTREYDDAEREHEMKKGALEQVLLQQQNNVRATIDRELGGKKPAPRVDASEARPIAPKRKKKGFLGIGGE